MNIVARQNLRRVTAGDSSLAKTLTRLHPGRVVYFIKVDLIVSHQLAIKLDTVSCHYAVCRWHDLKKSGYTLAETLWCPSLGPLSLIPLAKIASAALFAPLDLDEPASSFRVLIKPNQLIMWHPDKLFIEVPVGWVNNFS